MSDDQKKDGGNFWAKRHGLVQTMGYLDPETHDYLLKISESSGVPVSEILNRLAKKMKEEETRKQILGVREKSA